MQKPPPPSPPPPPSRPSPCDSLAPVAYAMLLIPSNKRPALFLSCLCCRTCGCPTDAGQDWGEQMNGARNPRLFVASFRHSSVRAVQGAPEGITDFTAGLPTFTPDGTGVVYVAWNNLPRRLGIVFCHNRPSSLHLAPNPFATPSTGPQDEVGAAAATPSVRSSPVSVSHPLLTPHDWMVIAPSFSTSSKPALHYLASEEDTTHRFGLKLQQLPWPLAVTGPSAPAPRVVVDKVDKPAPGAFPGLYGDDITRDAWGPGGSHVLLSTFYGARHTVVKVDTGAAPGGGPGSVQDYGAWVLDRLHAQQATRFDSVTLLGQCDAGVVLRVEAPSVLPHVCFVPRDTSLPLQLLPQPAPATSPAAHAASSDLQWETITVQPSVDKDHAPFDGVLITPKREPGSTKPLPPLLVFP
jgi:hypothetical protein